jgi:hypothetical protein
MKRARIHARSRKDPEKVRNVAADAYYPLIVDSAGSRGKSTVLYPPSLPSSFLLPRCCQSRTRSQSDHYSRRLRNSSADTPSPERSPLRIPHPPPVFLALRSPRGIRRGGRARRDPQEHATATLRSGERAVSQPGRPTASERASERASQRASQPASQPTSHPPLPRHGILICKYSSPTVATAATAVAAALQRRLEGR